MTSERLVGNVAFVMMSCCYGNLPRTSVKFKAKKIHLLGFECSFEY